MQIDFAYIQYIDGALVFMPFNHLDIKIGRKDRCFELIVFGLDIVQNMIVEDGLLMETDIHNCQCSDQTTLTIFSKNSTKLTEP